MTWRTISDCLEAGLMDAIEEAERTEAGAATNALPPRGTATVEGAARIGMKRTPGETGAKCTEPEGREVPSSVPDANRFNVRSMATVFTRRPAKSSRRRSAVVIDLVLVRAQRHASAPSGAR